MPGGSVVGGPERDKETDLKLNLTAPHQKQQCVEEEDSALCEVILT